MATTCWTLRSFAHAASSTSRPRNRNSARELRSAAVSEDVADDIHDRVGFHLLQDAGALVLHREEARAERAGDLLGGQAGDHQVEHLALTGCEPGQTLARLRPRLAGHA